MRKIAVRLYVGFVRFRVKLLRRATGLFLAVTGRDYFIWKTKQGRFRVYAPDGELQEIWSNAIVGNFREFELGCDIVSRFCGPNPTVFVVGSNIGLNELPLSGLGGAEIYSFEPVPSTYTVLQRNIEINRAGNVRHFNIGFSNAKGSFEISIAEDSGSNSLVRTNASKGTVTCEFDTLDGFAASHGIQTLDFLKIDTEGHDIEVLKGGAETIRRCNPVVQIEINRVGSEQTQEYDIDWLLGFCERFAADYYEIYQDKLIPVKNLSSFLDRPSIQNDLLIVPPGR